MTREEFESILEECFIEGYNSALEDIEEDILDEEAYDLEKDYDYYTENQEGHPRTLRGTGIHNLPKGILGALKSSQRAYKKLDKAFKDHVDAIRSSEKKKKFIEAEKDANKKFEEYKYKRFHSPEYDEFNRRHYNSYSYKNPIKRIIDRKALHAGENKIMGKRNFLNLK